MCARVCVRVRPNNSELSSAAESSPPDAFMACDVHQLWTAGQVAAKAKSRNGRTELKPSRSHTHLSLSCSLFSTARKAPAPLFESSTRPATRTLPDQMMIAAVFSQDNKVAGADCTWHMALLAPKAAIAG